MGAEALAVARIAVAWQIPAWQNALTTGGSMFWRPSKDEIALDDAVRAAGRTATRFTALRLPSGGSVPVIASRFGGEPYSEAGESWPTLAGHPYDFIAQFHLRDCAERPTEVFDLMTVFLCWGVLEGEITAKKDDFDRACLVRCYRDPTPAKAVPLARPAPAKKSDLRVVPCTARAERVLAYPSPINSYKRVPSIAAALRPFKDAGQAYRQALKRLRYDWREEHTQVSGYPNWIHDNTLDDDDLLFMAQIAHEPEANFCVGDAGLVLIAARRADPMQFVTDPFQSH